jgi:hypothetical protein
MSGGQLRLPSDITPTNATVLAHAVRALQAGSRHRRASAEEDIAAPLGRIVPRARHWSTTRASARSGSSWRRSDLWRPGTGRKPSEPSKALRWTSSSGRFAARHGHRGPGDQGDRRARGGGLTPSRRSGGGGGHEPARSTAAWPFDGRDPALVAAHSSGAPRREVVYAGRANAGATSTSWWDGTGRCSSSTS